MPFALGEKANYQDGKTIARENLKNRIYQCCELNTIIRCKYRLYLPEPCFYFLKMLYQLNL